MKRRELLRIAPVAAVVPLAGCTESLRGDGGDDGDGDGGDGDGGGGDGGDGDGGDGDGGTTTVDVPTDEAIGTARDHLRDATETLGENAEATDFSEDEYDFETEGIRSSLSKAADALDRAAASDPTDEQREEIQSLRTFREMLSALTSMLASVAAGFDHLSSGQSALESDRFEAAADDLEAANSEFRTAREHLRTTRGALDGLEESPVPDADWGDLDELEDVLRKFDALLAVMEPFTSGYREFALGTPVMQEGFRAYEEEDYATAAREFERARDRFETAHGEVERARDRSGDVEDESLDDVETSLGQLSCYTGALRDTADAMLEAAEAARAGDEEAAREATERARGYTDRCGDSSDDGSSAALRVVDRLRAVAAP